MIIEIIVIAAISSIVIMFTILKVTDYLIDKPKTNKFRKWWSSHIVDLDHKYHD